MFGNKSFLMLIIICILSLGFMILIGGTESNPSTVELNDTGEHVPITPPELEERNRTIEVSLHMDPEAFRIINEWNLLFAEEHPEIEVILHLETEEPEFEDYRTSLLLGNASDILWMPNAWVHQLASTGYLQPLDEWFKSDEQALYIHPMLTQVRWNSYLWGVPGNVDPYGLIWNQALLEGAGLNIAALSMEQLGLALEEYEGEIRLDWEWDSSDAWALSNVYLAMGDSARHVIPDEAAPFSWERINNAEKAFTVAPYSDYQKYAAAEVEFRPLFSAQTPWQEMLPGRSYVIASQSAVKEEAWRWIQFMSQKEVQLELMEAGQGIPALAELMEAPHWAHVLNQKELLMYSNSFMERMEIKSLSESYWMKETSLDEFTETLDTYRNIDSEALD